MKTVFSILILMFLFSVQAFSQDESDNSSDNQKQEPQQIQQEVEPQQEPQPEQQTQQEPQPEQQTQQEPQPEQQTQQEPQPEQQTQQEPQPEQQTQQEPQPEQQTQQEQQPEQQTQQEPQPEQQTQQEPQPEQQTQQEQQPDYHYGDDETQEQVKEEETVIDYTEYKMENVTTWETQQIEEAVPPEELKELCTSNPDSLSEAIDDLTQKQLQILEELPLEKLAEALNISEQAAEVLQKELSSNTEPVQQTYQFTEEISNEKVLEIIALKDDKLSEVIESLPEEQVKELILLPPDKLAQILKVPLKEALYIHRKIKFNTVIPYDKTPVHLPESMNALPGGKETVGTLNYFLTAGLDMTPLERKRAQKIVIIVILCTLLPNLFKKKST